MLSLANIKSKVNVASIGNMMGETSTLEYLIEVEGQFQSTIEMLERKIQILKKLHTYQSISMVDIITLKEVFPDRAGFISSIPVTETPSRTGFTVIVTELYDGIMAEIVSLISWTRQRYINVIPVATDEREDGTLVTDSVMRFKTCLAAVNARYPYIASVISHNSLVSISSALIQSGINSPDGKADLLKEITSQLSSGHPSRVCNILSSAAVVSELVHQLGISRALLNMAQVKEFSTLSGLTERLVVVSTAGRILKSVKIIPLWKDALLAI